MIEGWPLRWAMLIIMHSGQKPHAHFRLLCVCRVLLKYSQKRRGWNRIGMHCDGACLDMYLFIRSYVWWNGKTGAEWKVDFYTVARQSFVGAQKKWCYKNLIFQQAIQIFALRLQKTVCVWARARANNNISTRSGKTLQSWPLFEPRHAAATLRYYSSAGPLLLL